MIDIEANYDFDQVDETATAIFIRKTIYFTFVRTPNGNSV